MGRIEKNGAVLTCEKGRMAYVQADPISGVYAAYNPLPDPTDWAFSVPGGIKVKADGDVERPATRHDRRGQDCQRQGLRGIPQRELSPVFTSTAERLLMSCLVAESHESLRHRGRASR
jgi:hypothetical protein